MAEGSESMIRRSFAVAREVREETVRDHVVIVAAGVAFYSVLALLPALIITLSLYGIFTDVEEAERQIDAVLEVLPGDAMRVIDTQMRVVAEASHAHLSVGFGASILMLAWTVSGATRALVGAIKLAYNQEHEKSVLERRFVAMVLSLGVIAVLVAVFAMIAAVPVWLSRFDPTHAIVTFGHLRWIAVAVLVTLGAGLLYRYAPPDRPNGWRQVLPGALLATFVWTAVSVLFSLYVSHFSSYDQTYGTLGASVILLMWFWLAALAVILGAELNQVLVERRSPAPA